MKCIGATLLISFGLLQSSRADPRVQVGVFVESSVQISGQQPERSTAFSAKSGIDFGFRYSYQILRYWKVETELSQQWSKSTVSALRGGIRTLWGPFPEQHFRPFLAIGIGTSLYSQPTSFSQSPEASLGTGFSVDISSILSLRWDASVSIPCNNRQWSKSGQMSVGISWSFPTLPPTPPSDSDGDGVFDDLDLCPLRLENQNGYKDDDGCPDSLQHKAHT